MPIEDKESYKWLKSYQATAAVQANCPRTTLVSVGDREADIYELLQEAAAHPEGPKLLVRAEHNRKLQDEQQRLWETMQARPVEAVQVLQVPSRAIAPHARRAWRFATPPSVWSHPEGATAPRLRCGPSWLKSTMPPPASNPWNGCCSPRSRSSSVEQACERLMWYSRRWGIEVLHRTLKSGCRIEQRHWVRPIGLGPAWRSIWSWPGASIT